MSAEICSSSPERPGELVCRTECAPDGVIVAVTVTRADHWVLVARDFATRLVDDGLATADGQVLTVGRPKTVTYRRVREFSEHADLYQRVDTPPAPNVNAVQDDALATGPGRVKGYKNPLTDRVDELQAVLDEVLGYFHEKGHPGYEAQRTGWVRVEKLAEWRRVAAGRPSWNQLFALIDVKLTPWQQDILADGWSYRETHGRWPAWASLPDEQRSGHKTLQAAAAELLERARACGWAE